MDEVISVSPWGKILMGAARTLIVLAVLVAVCFGIDFALFRTIPVVDERGYEVTLTRFEIQGKDGTIKTKLTGDGKLRVPRWSTSEVRVKDPRYKGETWAYTDFGPRLEVDRREAADVVVTVAEKGKALAEKGTTLWKTLKKEPAKEE
jgi:hypothetical protein